ncbi:dCTP deaminase [Patescibacteria group bacterium]|nr:dCTP deaminase [Candidatus Dojkabacteria bacterium]CAG1020429.1 dCTP deaminase [Patescibacteria group bacterium]
MSILTDTEILNLIQQKKITIEPFNEKHLRAGKYEVHLGQYILKPQNKGALIDPTIEGSKPEYKKFDLKEEAFILKPGMFILGQTNELIGLDSDTAMFIDGGSSIARLGLTIHQSASYIPPGQDPHIITLEIYNAGIWDVKLSFGLRIGKLITFRFNQKNKTDERSNNPYNGQKEATGSLFAKMI